MHEKVAVGKKFIGVRMRQKKNLCLHGVETRKKGKTYNTSRAKINV